MQLSPTQIVIISISFSVAIIIALIWYYKDRNSDIAKNDESFSILMTIFFWSVAFSFVLKMALDLLSYYNPGQIYNTMWFLIVSLFIEELVKIAALLMGVELAGKLFNELSDGVIFTVFAALGFIFLENILYLVPFAEDVPSFLRVLAGRSIFTFAMHLFTVIFGVFYAIAYLRSDRLKHGHRVRPWQIGKQIKMLWKQFGLMLIFWLPMAPFVTIWKFSQKGLKTITIPEVLWSGFLLSSYLHIGYDLLLELQIPALSAFAFFVVIMFLGGLYLYFEHLDLKIQST